MGKDRRLTISRSELFLGSLNQSGDHHVDEETEVELELTEEDVWSVLDSYEPTEQSACNAPSLEASGRERRRNKNRMSESNVGRNIHVATSAPVKVPDWSKILKLETAEPMRGNYNADVADEMLPPHEYVARSRNGNGVSSVFLGVGRTLKGRDMRRVRDAVWSQTGFYG